MTSRFLPESTRRTLFPEPGSSGKGVLYFVLPRHHFPLVMPRVMGVKLPFPVYFGFRRADEQKFQFLPSLYLDYSGPMSQIGDL